MEITAPRRNEKKTEEKAIVKFGKKKKPVASRVNETQEENRTTR